MNSRGKGKGGRGPLDVDFFKIEKIFSIFFTIEKDFQHIFIYFSFLIQRAGLFQSGEGTFSKKIFIFLIKKKCTAINSFFFGKWNLKKFPRYFKKKKSKKKWHNLHITYTYARYAFFLNFPSRYGIYATNIVTGQHFVVQHSTIIVVSLLFFLLFIV